MKNLFKKKNTGFTLVETLVAISIFTMSIMGLLIILSKGISDLSYTKKKIIAGYLAQEGIEYIRNLRDTSELYNATDSQHGWDAFYAEIIPVADTLCAATNGCYFDDRNVSFVDVTLPMTDLIITACSSSNCSEAPLLLDSITGKYGYVSSGSTTNSGFSRKIHATTVGTPVNEIKISSTVYWTQGSGSYSTVFTEDLYNWME